MGQTKRPLWFKTSSFKEFGLQQFSTQWMGTMEESSGAQVRSFPFRIEHFTTFTNSRGGAFTTPEDTEHSFVWTLSPWISQIDLCKALPGVQTYDVSSLERERDLESVSRCYTTPLVFTWWVTTQISQYHVKNSADCGSGPEGPSNCSRRVSLGNFFKGGFVGSIHAVPPNQPAASIQIKISQNPLDSLKFRAGINGSLTLIFPPVPPFCKNTLTTVQLIPLKPGRNIHVPQRRILFCCWRPVNQWIPLSYPELSCCCS